MNDYVFKTYIQNGEEHYIYGTGEDLTEKVVPFPDSLVSFLSLDINEMIPLFRWAASACDSLYSTMEWSHADELLGALEEAARKHIYFMPLYLEWSQRLSTVGSIPGNLPNRFTVSDVPYILDQIQRNAHIIVSRALELDPDKAICSGSLSIDTYTREDGWRHSFPFHPLCLTGELVDQSVYTEVLYAKKPYDIVAYHLWECVRRRKSFCKCHLCGKYYYVSDLTDPFSLHTGNDTEHTCAEPTSQTTYTDKAHTDEIASVYRKAYNRRYNKMHRGKLTKKKFDAWRKQARRKQEMCRAGKITLEELNEWFQTSDSQNAENSKPRVRT